MNIISTTSCQVFYAEPCKRDEPSIAVGGLTTLTSAYLRQLVSRPAGEYCTIAGDGIMRFVSKGLPVTDFRIAMESAFHQEQVVPLIYNDCAIVGQVSFVHSEMLKLKSEIIVGSNFTFDVRRVDIPGLNYSARQLEGLA